jgi:hypothetical protein
VKRDPTRLAKWQTDQADERERVSRSFAGVDVLEVTGCDHTQLIGCAHPSGGEHNSAQSDEVVCFVPPPTATPRR